MPIQRFTGSATERRLLWSGIAAVEFRERSNLARDAISTEQVSSHRFRGKSAIHGEGLPAEANKIGRLKSGIE
jgi:hypothetical protein